MVVTFGWCDRKMPTATTRKYVFSLTAIDSKTSRDYYIKQEIMWRVARGMTFQAPKVPGSDGQLRLMTPMWSEYLWAQRASLFPEFCVPAFPCLCPSHSVLGGPGYLFAAGATFPPPTHSWVCAARLDGGTIEGLPRQSRQDPQTSEGHSCNGRLAVYLASLLKMRMIFLEFFGGITF